MKIKTSELSGTQLDWAVGKADNYEQEDFIYCDDSEYMGFYDHDDVFVPYSPSTNWSQGGPIIEREGIEVALYTWAMPDLPNEWVAKDVYWEYEMLGATFIEAAMRCYVASKLGDEIEIPEELV